MNHLVVLQEDPGAGPGLFAAAAEKRGLPLRTVEAARGDWIPSELPSQAGLMVLGGQMTAPELEICPYLVRWIRLIRWAIASKRPVLGIGTGAHLIARALEAQVYPARKPEFGWDSVTLTKEGMADPLFSGLPVYLPVFQWHSDDFHLPRGAIRLATSKASPNQTFRFGAITYGLQFHMEVTDTMVRDWCTTRLGPPERLSPRERRRFEVAFMDREASAMRAERLFKNFLEISQRG